MQTICSALAHDQPTPSVKMILILSRPPTRPGSEYDAPERERSGAGKEKKRQRECVSEREREREKVNVHFCVREIKREGEQ